MQVELICADAFDPEHGLVAHGPVDHVVADPADRDKVHRHHRITRKGAGGARARQELGFEALTPGVVRRAAAAFAEVVRRWVVVLGDREGARARGDEHSIQKPLWLMEAVLRELTDPGELVADPYAGSGTTLVAAVRLGRAARGWERAEPWARAAQRRIARTQPRLDLLERPRLRAEQLELEDA